MPNKLSWLALGCGAFVAFALSLFPATTAYRWFAPDSFRLSGIEGTVWSGQAALGSVPGLPMRNLRWNLNALPLVLGRISGQFEARLADGFINGEASVSPNVVILTNLQAATSLPALAGLLPLEDTVGLVSLSLERLELQRSWPRNIVGNLRINELEVVPLFPTDGENLIPLGNYEVTFIDSSGQGVSARLRDTGGPLEVSGRLELGLDRAYVLEGLIRARPDASDELVQGIAIMTGEPDAEGRREFSLTGSL